MSEVHPAESAVYEAIDRIARTSDGAMLYVHLQRRLMSISTEDSESALRRNEGERTFASKLIGLMAKGIFESGGRTGHIGSSIGPGGGEQPLVVPSPEPVRTGRQRNPGGRRITERDRVPGYDYPDEA